jgi:hypothetical protein
MSSGSMAPLSAGLNIIGAVAESEAIKAEGRFRKQQAEHNAKLAEMAAEDALFRGDSDARQLKRDAKKLMGEQKVSFAAQGIQLEGSALDVLEETDRLAELEVMKIKNNAFKEAFGFKTEASQARLRGRMAELSARTQSNLTLITGGSRAAGSFSR